MNEAEDLNRTIENLSCDLRRYAAGMLKRCQSGLTMKNLLRDHLRTRRRLRRGGDRSRVQLEIVQGLEAANVDPLVFIELLDELEAMGEERKLKVAVARVLYRLSNEEIAHQLGVSVSTVEDDMRKTREWLKERLYPD